MEGANAFNLQLSFLKSINKSWNIMEIVWNVIGLIGALVVAIVGYVLYRMGYRGRGGD